ncbi:MAG: membrane protein insertase YidC [Rikenellaceae bacterium]|nr:membrane protein insertase YidC [Rikenellaceae bacterium]
MNKNSVIGLVLIGIVLLAFSWWNSKQREKQLQYLNTVNQTTTYIPSNGNSEVNSIPSDNLNNDYYQQQLSGSLGEYLYSSLEGSEEIFTVENDVMVISFSNKGGRIVSVELKDYKRYNGEPLYLFDKNNAEFNISLFTNTQINTSQFYFKPEKISGNITVGETTENIPLRLYVDSVSFIEFNYTIYPDDYMIDFDIRMVGMENKLAPHQSDIILNWSTVAFQNEKGYENENNYSTVAYMYPNDSSLEDLGTSKDSKKSKSKDINSKIKWVGFKQQFFSSIIIAEDSFQNGSVAYETFEPGTGKLKKFNTQLAVPFSPMAANYNFKFYFGPNKYNILNNYDLELQKLVPLGGWLIRWINRLIVIPTFDILNKFISSYGVIILLLTIIIKLILFPLTYKSYLSMAKMRALKPDIDQLNEKYPDQKDAMKKQQATMEIYQRAGVNPMGGCLPLLVQMPILFAMFRFFPASIELRGESFLWADDLSSYDSILNLPFEIPFYGDHVSLFTLLMAVAMFVSSKLNFNQTSAGNAPQMAGMKFMTLYLMPIMLLFWFNNYSSGLSYYYFLSNIITMGQTIGFRYAIDEKELHKKMKETPKKPKKKSKFMQRYEDAMKQQQQMAKNNKR